MSHYFEPWLLSNRPSATLSISTNRADFIDFEEDLYTRWDPTYGTVYTVYGRGRISVSDSAGNLVDFRDGLYIPDYPGACYHCPSCGTRVRTYLSLEQMCASLPLGLTS